MSRQAFPGRQLNTGPPEDKSELLHTTPRHSVVNYNTKQNFVAAYHTATTKNSIQICQAHVPHTHTELHSTAQHDWVCREQVKYANM